MISFGQNPCDIQITAKLVSYSYEDEGYGGPYYSLDFNFQNMPSKNYIVYHAESKNFDIKPKDFKKGTYYSLNLSLVHSENTSTIYYEQINNIGEAFIERDYFEHFD